MDKSSYAEGLPLSIKSILKDLRPSEYRSAKKLLIDYDNALNVLDKTEHIFEDYYSGFGYNNSESGKNSFIKKILSRLHPSFLTKSKSEQHNLKEISRKPTNFDIPSIEYIKNRLGMEVDAEKYMREVALMERKITIV